MRSYIKTSFVLSFLLTSSVRPILQNIEKWSIRHNKDHHMYVVNDHDRGDYYKSSSSNLMGRKLIGFFILVTRTTMWRDCRKKRARTHHFLLAGVKRLDSFTGYGCTPAHESMEKKKRRRKESKMEYRLSLRNRRN